MADEQIGCGLTAGLTLYLDPASEIITEVAGAGEGQLLEGGEAGSGASSSGSSTTKVAEEPPDFAPLPVEWSGSIYH